MLKGRHQEGMANLKHVSSIQLWTVEARSPNFDLKCNSPQVSIMKRYVTLRSALVESYMIYG